MDKIKKIWISQENLIEQESQKKREGFLLKILFSGGEIGYSSLHPYCEFGESSSSEYISLLGNLDFVNKLILNRKLSREIRVLFLALKAAKQDGEARSKNKNLLFGFPKIENHFLIRNVREIKSFDNFSHRMFKIKMGDCLSTETFFLRKAIQSSSKDFKLRLDFNMKVSKLEFYEWEALNKDLSFFTDFIEDPFFNFSKTNSVFSLAEDWPESSFSPVKIIKPSRKETSEVYKALSCGCLKRVVFTNTLTHPLEARWSLFEAHQFYKTHPSKKEICGLEIPCDFYEKNDFFRSFFEDLSGKGLGFDFLLEKRKWRLL